MVKVVVKYKQLSGQEITRVEDIPTTKICDDFPTHLAKGDAIIFKKKEPYGMFVITRISRKQKTINLKEINCTPVHWKGDERGRGHGPDEDCKTRKCILLNNCPISAHLMMTARED